MDGPDDPLEKMDDKRFQKVSPARIGNPSEIRKSRMGRYVAPKADFH
ncbi:hypothetical protein B8V81_2189 [Paenibacillus pasadenensis]|uniref:Uncharacterized protein n=1 Tax=Paenibacillus pasadenensis TaxID=217090 RepID=A0A2N5N099_9BACL|nr:hypothetical protein B8V81_2189 [Paenibacillus pasadenensis]